MTLTQAHAIIEEVAAEHGVTAQDIYGRSRKGPIVKARICAIRRIRVETGLKLISIARLLGRDHSTIAGLLNRRAGGARARTSGRESA